MARKKKTNIVFKVSQAHHTLWKQMHQANFNILIILTVLIVMNSDTFNIQNLKILRDRIQDANYYSLFQIKSISVPFEAFFPV
jgi:hypothetical protein